MTLDENAHVCTSDPYFCPTSGEVESACHGGFDTCCDRPDLHRPPPQRIQRQRTKGWRMPDGAVYVGRPSEWGNPFVVSPGPVIPPVRARMWDVRLLGTELLSRWDTQDLARADAADRFRRYLAERSRGAYRALGFPWEDRIRAKLAGKDLCCWCPLDAPCHADVLLELANGGAP